MANRTIKFFGQGFGTDPAEITVTANGTTVFSGAVPTVNQPVWQLPNLELQNSTVELFSYSYDANIQTPIPMTCEVTNSSTVIFAQISSNYFAMPNPAYTSEQLAILTNPSASWNDKVNIMAPVANPALTQTEIDTLLDPAVSGYNKALLLIPHKCYHLSSSGENNFGFHNSPDARGNSVAIDGVEQTPDRQGPYQRLDGTWWWQINGGSTLSYNLTLPPPFLS